MELRVCKLVPLFFLAVAIQQTFASEPEKIITSYAASPGEFPYQVYLDFDTMGYCGGALISDRHVLTAAHCVYKKSPAEVTVVTGTTNLFIGGQRHKTKAIHTHEYYEPSVNDSFANDIAIVTLAEPITVNEYQRPIRLATMDPPDNEKILLTGWGSEYVGGPVADELKKVYLYTLDNGFCKNQFHESVESSQLCTQPRTGLGACYGDNGSPLVYNGRLVAIVSPVMSCGNGTPDVFTRVNHFADFISKTQSLS